MSRRPSPAIKGRRVAVTRARAAARRVNASGAARARDAAAGVFGRPETIGRWARACSSVSTTLSLFPLCVARWSGVRPFDATAFGSSPRLRKSRTRRKSPHAAAACSGVCPGTRRSELQEVVLPPVGRVAPPRRALRRRAAADRRRGQ
eukprot:1261103-Prymnesium_polylepis.1